MSLVAVVAMVFSLLTITAGAAASSVSEAKNSVVVVISETGGYGTGFAIGEEGKPVEYIVTNNHVVDGDKGCTTATIAFDLASNDYVNANVYFYDANKDIAILKLPKPTDKRQPLVICPMKDVNPDDTFAALGYPGNQVTEWPKYNTDDITVTKGGIKKADRLLGMDVYMLDLDITHGNSGGPLVNSAGEVCGINTFGVNGENYAIAIDELLAVIDTDKIAITLHGEVNWIIIIGAAVLAAILILVLVLLLTRKKGPKKEDLVYADVVDDQNVVVPVQAQPPVQTSAGPAARLIAVSGTLNGKRFTVSGVTKIGRDAARCPIAFPVNTQGVSGVHCEIAFDGAVCYVKDLGSSYGTFTLDGKKLAPNAAQMLRSGDKFYLASPENTFEVRF